MGERVPVNDLLPGDWIGEIDGRYIDPEQRVAQIDPGPIYDGIGEWGIRLANERCFYLKGPVDRILATRATPEEALRLDIEDEGDRVQRRAAREQARAQRAGGSHNERLLRRMLGRLQRD